MIDISNYEYINDFEVKSNDIIIFDPCFSKNEWCSMLIEDVKRGIWESYVKINDDDGSISELMVIYKNLLTSAYKNHKWNKIETDICIDSGQCAILDNDIFSSEKINTLKNCKDTIKLYNYGSINNGVISLSGYGEGEYSCYVIDDINGIIGVKVIFIEEILESDYDYDDDIMDD